MTTATARRSYTRQCFHCGVSFEIHSRITGDVCCSAAACMTARNAEYVRLMAERSAILKARRDARPARNTAPTGDANGWGAVLAFQGTTKAQRLAAERVAR